MGIAIENMLTAPPVAPENEVLLPVLNQEISDQCGFTQICGSSCVLHMSHLKAGPSLTPEEHWKLAQNIISRESSDEIGTYAIAGKEPTEEPQLLADIVRAWHSRSEAKRPKHLAVVTADRLGLRSVAAKLSSQTPIPSLFVSVDHAASGLRNGRYATPLLEEALELRRRGLVRSLAVNTTFREHDHDEVLAIGARIAETGVVDQWSAGMMLKTDASGLIRAAVSPAAVARLLEKLAAQFSNQKMAVVMSIDAPTFLTLPGMPVASILQSRNWRYVFQKAPGVIALALNDQPWVLARARWDGEILTYQDFVRAGTKRGSLGRWPNTTVEELLNRVAALRHETPIADAADADDSFVQWRAA